MHEDIPFNVRIGPIEIENIVTSTAESVIEELGDSPWPRSAGKIYDVVQPGGRSKPVAFHNAITGRRQAISVH